MEFANKYEFEATVEQVFDAMINPDVIASCLPGCEPLEHLGDNRYKTTLTLGVGAIQGRFQGTVELCDLDRPKSFILKVEGRGNTGFAKGEGNMQIQESDPGSLVIVLAQVQVGGPIARVGQRLLLGVAHMMAGKFFECLRKKIASGSDVPDP